MPAFKDLTGRVINNMRVESRAGYNSSGKITWLVTCLLCNKQTTVTGNNLLTGNTTNCGCKRIIHATKLAILNANNNYKHCCSVCGQLLVTHKKHTAMCSDCISLLNTWRNIKTRCLEPKSTSYRNYGGRGISICAEWLNSFKSYYLYAINNGWKLGLQIHRINNNGNYEPGNVMYLSRSAHAKLHSPTLVMNNRIRLNNKKAGI